MSGLSSLVSLVSPCTIYWGEGDFLADAFSRLPQYKSLKEEIVNSIIPSKQHAAQCACGNPKRAPLGQEKTHWLSNWKKPCERDEWFQKHMGDLMLKQDLVWEGNKIYVLASQRTMILQKSHYTKPARYFGFVKILHLIKRQFLWPKIKKDIETYVASCPICGFNGAFCSFCWITLV